MTNIIWVNLRNTNAIVYRRSGLRMMCYITEGPFKRRKIVNLLTLRISYRLPDYTDMVLLLAIILKSLFVPRHLAVFQLGTVMVPLYDNHKMHSFLWFTGEHWDRIHSSTESSVYPAPFLNDWLYLASRQFLLVPLLHFHVLYLLCTLWYDGSSTHSQPPNCWHCILLFNHLLELVRRIPYF